MSLGAIDVSELITDPDFARPFTIRRQTAAMSPEGEAVTTSSDIAARGVQQPASAFEIKQLPEGDRLTNVIMVASTTQILGTLGSPDIIVLGDGSLYRVIKVEQRARYWKAFAEGYTP